MSKWVWGLTIVALFLALLAAVAAGIFPFRPAPARESEAAVLSELLDTIVAHDIAVDSILVARGNRVALDVYRYPFRADLRHDVASIAKSVTALVAGTALAGRPAFGQNIAATQDGSTTLGDALAMASGLDCGIAPGERELYRMLAGEDWLGFVNGLPRLEPGGGRFRYCSPNYVLAASVVARETGRPLSANAKQVLFDPLAIEDWNWPEGLQDLTRAWGELDLRARDLAKIGRMLLDDGRFEGKQVVPAAWLSAATRPQRAADPDNDYGIGFWLPKIAPGLIEARGRGGQRLFVHKPTGTLIVLTASGIDASQLAGFLPRLLTMSPQPPAGDEKRRLGEAIARFEAPPAARRAVAPGPSLQAVLGRTMTVNGSQWLRTLRIDQAGDTGTLTIEGPNGTFTSPLGFDGVPRLSGNGPEGAAIAGVAAWNNGELMIDVRAYGLAMRLELELRRRDGRFRVTGREATGLFAVDSELTPVGR